MKSKNILNSLKLRVLFILLTNFCFLSCRKQVLICEGNCFSLNIKGSVLNGITNNNEPSVPIIVDEIRPRTSIITSFKTVKDFSSNENGLFNVFTDVDSSIFSNGSYLRIRVKDNNDFLALPIRGENNYFRDVNSNTFDSVKLVVYPKANLKIVLNRIQTDNFQSFSVNYYFLNDYSFGAFFASSPNDISKKEVTVPTSTDLFTKIIITKRDMNGVSNFRIDSIRCEKNAVNTYTVNY